MGAPTWRWGITGNYNQPNRIYHNHDGQLVLAWSSTASDPTTSLAWGDSDNDGRLNLAAGNANKPTRLYRNTGSGMTLVWSAPEWDNTTSIAWGDVDGDGDFDLAVGNDGQLNRLYANTGGVLSLAWSSSERDATRALAWGDWDGDGDVDLAVGNYNDHNRLYLGPYDENAHSAYAGCRETLSAADRSIPLNTVADWQPLVIVQTVTSRTLAITATLAVSESALHVQVFSAYGAPGGLPPAAPTAAA